MKMKLKYAIGYSVLFVIYVGYGSQTFAFFSATYANSASYLTFSDYFHFVVSNFIFLSIPLLLLLFLFYYRFKEETRLKSMVVNVLANTMIHVIIMFTAILLAYLLSYGLSNGIDFSWSPTGRFEFSAISLSGPSAICISLVLIELRLICFSLICCTMNLRVRKNWISAAFVFLFSLIESTLRDSVTRSSAMVGMLPSENSSIFYMNEYLNAIPRVSIVYSVLYWIICIAILLITFRKHYKRIGGISVE